ncbi:hypothetical protein OJAV_G00027400 [Oryzias javanicus]|uniref:Formyl transferase C-terminal domain-containing protein n=1 Tax=Oryzias javanicus TaxID=123683 RepID=A0A3S2N6Z8_ORYJA|nr:hypothetical protein OJAV_G00027400 [Oryzias javanicus]
MILSFQTVGPFSNQLHAVPDGCSAEELGASLASKGAQLLLDTLKTLPERIAAKREQGRDGATFAPKISAAMSWVVWEEQTCEQIARLHRAIGSRIPLRTLWMGRTVKLLEFAGRRPLSGQTQNAVPGSVHFQKESGALAVRCMDGWVLFKAVLLKKRLTATDFYNGYLHQTLKKDTPHGAAEGRFISSRGGGADGARRRNESTPI